MRQTVTSPPIGPGSASNGDDLHLVSTFRTVTITSGFANESAPAWGYGGSRHAVERHDGMIEISSAVGNGTTVTVRVPLQANAE